MNVKYYIFLSLGIIVGLISCNKDPEVPNEYDDWKNPPKVANNGPDLDLNSIQGLHFHIFAPTCANSGCHDGTFEPDFRTVESSYNSLVNIPVIKVDDSQVGKFGLRVEPGNAGNSMLIRRCEVDLGGNSGIMPLSIDPGNDWLARKDEYLGRITKWINDGAKDQFGNAVPPRDLKPQMAGMVVQAGGTTFTRSGNYNPVEVPVGTGNITVYFAYVDDNTSPQKFTINTADTSQNPARFTGNAMSLNLLSSPRNMKGLFDEDRDYWHSLSLNVSRYKEGEVLWFQTTVGDNVSDPINIPSRFSNFNNQKYFAIIFK